MTSFAAARRPYSALTSTHDRAPRTENGPDDQGNWSPACRGRPRRQASRQFARAGPFGRRAPRGLRDQRTAVAGGAGVLIPELAVASVAGLVVVREYLEGRAAGLEVAAGHLLGGCPAGAFGDVGAGRSLRARTARNGQTSSRRQASRTPPRTRCGTRLPPSPRTSA